MNSYERKLVHDAVADIDGVETESRGVDPERYVVIVARLSAQAPSPDLAACRSLRSCTDGDVSRET